MTRIRMLRDVLVAPAGHTVVTYREGEIYPQPAFPTDGWIVEALFDQAAAELVDENGDPVEADGDKPKGKGRKGAKA